jgi:osmoprotectant transport system substrate-binding protein
MWTLALGLLAGCGDTEEPAVTERSLDDGAITVASFDFPENVLLAELYSQALEHSGFRVHRSFGLGPRELVAPALAQGLVEVVPEYAGTSELFLDIGTPRPPVRALAAAPAENANAIVVTRSTARRLGLRSISDLRGVADELTFGGPPECPSRPLCLRGLRQEYGVAFDEFIRLDTGGPVTRQALLDGSVDVGLLFSTDPALGGSAELVELTDDRDLQPDENIRPLVHRETARRFEGLAEAIDAVSVRLTTADLRTLNARIEDDPGAVVAVATNWLEGKGLR